MGGNLKYDFDARAAEPGRRCGRGWQALAAGEGVDRGQHHAAGRAGDVDEDDVVIDAFREAARQHPELVLILAPRKPERFDVAARKLEAAGIAVRAAVGDG